MVVKVICPCRYCSIKKWHKHFGPGYGGRYVWIKNQDQIYNRLHIPEKDFLILQSHGIKLRMCQTCLHIYVKKPTTK